MTQIPPLSIRQIVIGGLGVAATLAYCWVLLVLWLSLGGPGQ